MKLIEKELGISSDDIEVQGYMVLLKAVVIPEVTKGGLYIPDTVRSLNQRDYDVGLVLAMGPEAYQHREKFPYGPYCEAGDWVYFTKYSHSEGKMNGHLCYFVPDEKVLCKIKNPAIVVKELREYKPRESAN